MNKVKINIWGRDFVIDIVFQNYPGEEVTPEQRETVETLGDADFDKALQEVKRYVVEDKLFEESEEAIKNIFRYVMPKTIVVIRDDEAKVFALICNYKLDMEHGLAVVFQNGKYKNVGPQDLIL